MATYNEPRFLAALRRKAERDGIPIEQLLRESRARAINTRDAEECAIACCPVCLYNYSNGTDHTKCQRDAS